MMGSGSKSSPSSVLEGLHGVKIVHKFPCNKEKTLHASDFDLSTAEASEIGGNLSLPLQWVLLFFEKSDASYFLLQEDCSLFIYYDFLIRRIWQQRPPCLRPVRCNLHGVLHKMISILFRFPSLVWFFLLTCLFYFLLGDQSIMETIANVLTSLPFIFLGFQAPRQVFIYK